jgi:hypothetical protein
MSEQQYINSLDIPRLETSISMEAIVNILEDVFVEEDVPSEDGDEVGAEGAEGVPPEEPIAFTPIPTNSPTALLDETTSRFSGAIWYDAIREEDVSLIGLGGIGSYVGFLLSRVKPRNIYMWDNDRVDISNMSGQLYGRQDVGEYKSNALGIMMSQYSNYYPVNAYGRFGHDSEATKVMMCGLDNMLSRKIVFTKWNNLRESTPVEERKTLLLIDGRLAAEKFQVFAIQGDDKRAIDLYKKEWLFDDREADETVCSYKQTSFMANMIASVMVNIFVNFVANKCNPLVERDVPFMTTYAADTMLFKVEM